VCSLPSDRVELLIVTEPILLSHMFSSPEKILYLLEVESYRESTNYCDSDDRSSSEEASHE